MKKKLFKILAFVLSAVLLVTGTFYFTLAYLHAKSDPVVNTFTAGKISLTLTETKVNEFGKELYFNTKYTPDGGEETDNIKTNANGSQEVLNGETGVTQNGDGLTTIQVLENDYKLLPSETYTKDPVINISEGSEPCYVYLAVYDGITQEFEKEGYDTVHDQLLANGWRLLGEGEEYLPVAVLESAPDGIVTQLTEGTADNALRNGGLKVYYHTGTDGSTSYKVDATNNAVTLETFDHFVIPADCEQETLDYLCSGKSSRNAEEDPVYADVVNKIVAMAFAVQTTGFSYDANNGTELDAVKAAWLSTFAKD